MNTLTPEKNTSNPMIKEFYEKKLPGLDAFLEKGWVDWVDTSDFKLVYRDEESGTRSIKSEVFINKNSKIIFDFLKELDNKRKYDSSYEAGYVFQEFDENFQINYVKHKGMFIVSARDFVNLVYAKSDENRSIILHTATQHQDLPKNKDAVRGEILYAGFLIEKITEEKSKLTFFSSVDVKLNQTLVNIALKKVSYAPKIIKGILEA
jgi:hypothetical protein